VADDTAAADAEARLVQRAASLERASEHLLGRAIVDAAHARGLALVEPRELVVTPGHGIAGRVDGARVVLGNLDALATHAIAVPEALRARADGLRADGHTVVFAAVDGALAGLLAVADPIKPTAAEALRALRADGVHVAMLTGDHRATARAVGAALGLAEADIVADVRPADKQAAIAARKARGAVVAMAGDGVNAAPALAAADVGIAMATGSDVAIESAGITLLGGDLRGLVRARRLARATVRNIRQNLAFAFVYNLAGVPIAAGALYPMFGLLLDPMWASAAMSLSSVSVIANALRLRRVRL
jgi:P-type Cu+ transporter